MKTKVSSTSEINKRRISRRRFLGATAVSLSTINSAKRLFGVSSQSHVKTVTLGRTGMRVCNIGYGTSRGNLDPSIINYAIEKGINYFDTSEGYGKGGAEVNLGKAIKKHRSKVHVITKVGSVNAAGSLPTPSFSPEFPEE
jgi:hypothetical protein